MYVDVNVARVALGSMRSVFVCSAAASARAILATLAIACVLRWLECLFIDLTAIRLLLYFLVAAFECALLVTV